MPVPNYPRYLCRAIERSIITISVRYADIHVQPRAISGRKYLAGLRIATYLCRWKRTQSQWVPCPQMHYFWLWITFFCQVVNFSEQCLVRKVAVANFATIAERQIALPWRLWPIRRIHIQQSKSGLTLYDSTPQGRTTDAQPRKCMLEIRSRTS